MITLMDAFDALPFIEALACGNDPISGASLPEDSPLHHPQIVRALFTALRLIETHTTTADYDTGNECPERAGESWDDDEDKRLAHAFHAGEPLTNIAMNHRRSRGAIASRLEHLGYVERNTTANTALRSPVPTDKWWRKERPHAGRPWTKEEDTQLQNLAASGLTTEEIARKLGRGTHGVDVRMSKLGIVLNSYPPSDPEEIPF